MDMITMGGYASYVYTAYAVVIAFLVIQWWLPWRKWRQYLNAKKNNATVQQKISE